jgi:hypothetical protein
MIIMLALAMQVWHTRWMFVQPLDMACMYCLSLQGDDCVAGPSQELPEYEDDAPHPLPGLNSDDSDADTSDDDDDSSVDLEDDLAADQIDDAPTSPPAPTRMTR